MLEFSHHGVTCDHILVNLACISSKKKGEIITCDDNEDDEDADDGEDDDDNEDDDDENENETENEDEDDNGNDDNDDNDVDDAGTVSHPAESQRLLGTSHGLQLLLGVDHGTVLVLRLVRRLALGPAELPPQLLSRQLNQWRRDFCSWTPATTVG